MPLRTILFLLGFVGAAGGALFIPIIGVLAYIFLYSIGVERQWWGAAAINILGLRYSLTMAAATAIGMALHWKSLRYGKTFLHSQEKLLLLFLGLVWLSTLTGEPTSGAYTTVDHPLVKMTKIVIFALMLTHIVTRAKTLDILMWCLVGGALALGLDAYMIPRSDFRSGRLETVGGPDFAESNNLAAYLAAILPIVGIQFLRSTWPGRLLSLATGVFAVNAIILTRSRGAVVGIATGCATALLLAPKKHRMTIAIALVVATAGGLYLTDPGYYHRVGTISLSEEEQDPASYARVEIWEASLLLLKDHPFGVGAGNFFQVIGRYNDRCVGRDAHNTFVRCYSELGVQGLLVFLALIGNAIWVLRRVWREAALLPEESQKHVMWLSYGFAISLATALACSMTVTLVYVEALWWLMVLPVCLERAVANLKADTAIPVRLPAAAGKAGGRARSRRRGRAPNPPSVKR